MNEPELLRSAVHKTTSAIMTQKHAREIVQELHAAGYHISPVLFDPENEHLRSLLDEAIAALEPYAKHYEFLAREFPEDGDDTICAGLHENPITKGHFRAAFEAIAKLRAARNG
jgi:hypothetical protein